MCLAYKLTKDIKGESQHILAEGSDIEKIEKIYLDHRIRSVRTGTSVFAKNSLSLLVLLIPITFSFERKQQHRPKVPQSSRPSPPTLSTVAAVQIRCLDGRLRPDPVPLQSPVPDRLVVGVMVSRRTFGMYCVATLAGQALQSRYSAPSSRGQPRPVV